MEASSRAWLALGASVAAYDILAPSGQTLSEGVDRGLEHSPARRAAIVALGSVTLAHLMNVIPERYDPFHYALIWKHTPEL